MSVPSDLDIRAGIFKKKKFTSDCQQDESLSIGFSIGKTIIGLIFFMKICPFIFFYEKISMYASTMSVWISIPLFKYGELSRHGSRSNRFGDTNSITVSP